MLVLLAESGKDSKGKDAERRKDKNGKELVEKKSLNRLTRHLIDLLAL